MGGTSVGRVRRLGGSAGSVERYGDVREATMMLVGMMLLAGSKVVGADSNDDGAPAATSIPLYSSCPGRSYIQLGSATGNVARIQTYQLDNNGAEHPDETTAPAAATPDKPGVTTTTPPHVEVGSYPKSAGCEWLITGKRRALHIFHRVRSPLSLNATSSPRAKMPTLTTRLSLSLSLARSLARSLLTPPTHTHILSHVHARTSVSVLYGGSCS